MKRAEGCMTFDGSCALSYFVRVVLTILCVICWFWNMLVYVLDKRRLNILAARAKNIALLAKLNWRLYQEKESLWAKVMLRKYCSQSRQKANDPDKLPCSLCWTAVKKGFPTFVEGICWSVGRNSKLKFWEDKWVKGESLRELMAGPLRVEEYKLIIKEIKEQICAIPMQLWGDKEDTLMWKFTRDGEFSMASAYALLRPQDNENQTFEGH
nr:putative ribonuclease h protein [Quercus suber]